MGEARGLLGCNKAYDRIICSLEPESRIGGDAPSHSHRAITIPLVYQLRYLSGSGRKANVDLQ